MYSLAIKNYNDYAVDYYIKKQNELCVCRHDAQRHTVDMWARIWSAAGTKQQKCRDCTCIQFTTIGTADLVIIIASIQKAAEATILSPTPNNIYNLVYKHTPELLDSYECEWKKYCHLEVCSTCGYQYQWPLITFATESRCVQCNCVNRWSHQFTLTHYKDKLIKQAVSDLVEKFSK